MGTPAIAADAVGITGNGSKRVGSVVEQLLAPADQRVEQIPVDLLYDHPDNPRGQLGDVDELADSIKASGIYEPLIVTPAPGWQHVDDRLPACEPGDYVIIAGHRRKAAAVQAGLTTVPCIVRDDLVGADAEVAMLVENLQREGLTPIQEAQGFAKLEAQGKSQREIARLVGCTQPHVSKRLSLLKLPGTVTERIGRDDVTGVTVERAVELARYADEPAVMRAVETRPSWKSAEQAAADARQAERAKTELEAERQKWRTRGVQHLVDYHSYNLTAYSTPRLLDHLEADGVDVSEHEHFACHGMAVGHDTSGNLRAVAVCINPKAHPESRENRESEAKTKAAAKAGRDKAASDRRRQARYDKLTELVKAKKLPDDTVELTERYLLEDHLEQAFDRDEWLRLGDLLDLPMLPAGDADETPDDRAEHFRAQLPAYLDVSPANVHRALVAAVLIAVEGNAEGGGWYGDKPTRARYFTMLAAHGHKLSGPEIKLAKDGSL